jgi:hypothetical protein
MNILWATTFCKEMWDTSASKLISSFATTQTPGKLVAYTEGMDLPDTPNAEGHRLEGDAFLANFLAKNRNIIPADCGGTAKEPLCGCPKGPLDVHSKKHRLPCVGFWFCRNAFRWLRKVRSAQLAAHAHRKTHDIMIWVDADSAFLQKTPPEVVESWFKGKYGCVYLKSKRAAIETGVVGYHLKLGGLKVIDAMAARYSTGRFRRDTRWDDCVQLGKAIDATPAVKTLDMATDVGPNSTVIQFSPMAEYLTHDKGLHRRTGVLK